MNRGRPRVLIWLAGIEWVRTIYVLIARRRGVSGTRPAGCKGMGTEWSPDQLLLVLEYYYLWIFAVVEHKVSHVRASYIWDPWTRCWGLHHG